MKVLYIHHAGFWGGSGRSLYELVTKLIDRGVTPCFICQKGACADVFESLGASVIRVNGLSQIDNSCYGYYRGWRWGIILRELYYFFPTFSAILKAKKKWPDIDLIHINEYTLTLPAILTAFIFKKSIVIHYRLLQRNPNVSFRAKIIRKIYNILNVHIVAIDEELASNLPGMNHISIIHNSYNKKSILHEDSMLKLPVYDKMVLVLGFVGSISVLKGIIELIESVAICNKRGLNIKLVVVGVPEVKRTQGLKSFLIKKIKGSSDVMYDIKQIITREGIEEAIDFIGFTKNIDAVYKKINILCFPSRLNAAGRPVFEAAFYKKPSIVAVDRSWTDTIIDGETGLIVKENDPVSIADAIEYLYNRRDVLNKLGKNAFKLAEKNFNPEKNADIVWDLYTGIVDGHEDNP